MQSQYNKIGRASHFRRWLLGLALLAVFNSVALPIERVWCDESGSGQPQLELGLNGNCLRQDDSCCNTANPALAATGAVQAQVTPKHDHCQDCSDVAAGKPDCWMQATSQLRVTPRLALQIEFARAPLLAAGISWEAASIAARAMPRPPDLATLHVTTTVLRF